MADQQKYELIGASRGAQQRVNESKKNCVGCGVRRSLRGSELCATCTRQEEINDRSYALR